MSKLIIYSNNDIVDLYAKTLEINELEIHTINPHIDLKMDVIISKYKFLYLKKITIFHHNITEEDMEFDGHDAVFSKPVSSVRNGFDIARYVPLAEDYESPGERAFCLEAVEDSDAWEAVGQAVDTVQQVITEKAFYNFNQRLSNALIRLYEGCEQLDSVDQAISALFLESSVLSVLLLRSYQHALDKLVEEMSAEEED